jgi:hypothetical protein
MFDKIWVCRVAYNGYANQAGALNNQQVIYRNNDDSVDPNAGVERYYFTNTTAENLCGSVTYPVPTKSLMEAAYFASDPLDGAIAKFRLDLETAYAQQLADPNKNLTKQAQLLACAFVQQHIYTSIPLIQPLYDPGKPIIASTLSEASPAYGWGAGATDLSCGEIGVGVAPSAIPPAAKNGTCEAGGPGTGMYPTDKCPQNQIGNFIDETVGSSSSFAGDLAAIQAAAGAAGFITGVKNRGWAGMGLWYHRIEELNDAADMSREIPVHVGGGDMMGVFPGTGSGIAEKVSEVLMQYDRWWDKITASAQSAGAIAAGTEVQAVRTSAQPLKRLQPQDVRGGGLKDLLGDVRHGRVADFLTDFYLMVGGRSINKFIYDVTDPADKDVYPLAKLTKMGGTMQEIAVTIYGGIAILEVVAAMVAGAADGAADGAGKSILGWFGGGMSKAVTEPFVNGINVFVAGPLTALITSLAGLLFAGAIALKYYLPLMPFIRVAHAVLTWMISIFEATIMVPVAALAHITTEGEGLSGNAKQAWMLWLNVLLRPVLTVAGFVAAMLIFNTFVVYMHLCFQFVISHSFDANGKGHGPFASIAYAIIYVVVIYTAANTSFKLLDLIPSAFFRWMGGSPDQSFDHDHSGAAAALGGLGNAVGSGFGKGGMRRAAMRNSRKRVSSGGDSGGGALTDGSGGDGA